ncbi:MAG: hypothetical protein K8U03_08580 [Planctomycetia bacterium]|nr:hypothetical protein [Planctomycetia bacterium]
MYHAELGQFTTRDPLPQEGEPDVLYDNNWFGRWLDMMKNLYGYTYSKPLNYVDPYGNDVWVEGSSGAEPAGHLSLAVGKPNARYESYSFGAIFSFSLRNGVEGVIYEDLSLGGQIDPNRYIKTPADVDAIIQKILQKRLNGPPREYRIGNRNCRTWTGEMFEAIKTVLEQKGYKLSPPPPITAVPVFPGTPKSIISSSDTSRPTSVPTTTSTVDPITSSTQTTAP